MKNTEIVSRRIFYFECVTCQKKRRQSFSRSKAGQKVCRSCRLGIIEREISKNQLNLFSEPEKYGDFQPEPV